MWMSREKAKRSLTLFWLGLAAALLMAMQLDTSFSAPVASEDASASECPPPSARMASQSAGRSAEDAG